MWIMNPALITDPVLRARMEAPFPFPKLPAEIRNDIYAYLIDEEDRSTRRVVRRKTKKADRKLRRRIIFPFSQVCQQLRHEFYGINIKNLSFSLSFDDAEDFIETFCRASVFNGVKITPCPRALSIVISKHSTRCRELYRCIDLLPLMGLRILYPSFACMFLEGLEQLNEVCNCGSTLSIDCKALNRIVNRDSEILRTQLERKNLVAVKVTLSSLEETQLHFIFKKSPFPGEQGTPSVVGGQSDVERLELLIKPKSGTVLKTSVLNLGEIDRAKLKKIRNSN